MIPSIQSSESSGSSISVSTPTSKSTSTNTESISGESRRTRTFSSSYSEEIHSERDSSSLEISLKVPKNGEHSSRSRSSHLLTTPQQLREILSMRYFCSSVPFRHYDEIIAGLYLGDMKTAKNILNLEKIGITHIINSAYCPSPFSDRELSQAYYEDRNFSCSFLGIPAQDYPSYKIGAYFDQTTQFIHEALKNEGSKVLVHCQVGVSRSASIVIAYLMMKKKMSAIQAVTFVGAIRPIFPNEGFLKQICELEYRLKNPKNVLVRSLSTVSRRTFRKVFNKKN